MYRAGANQCVKSRLPDAARRRRTISAGGERHAHPRRQRVAQVVDHLRPAKRMSAVAASRRHRPRSARPAVSAARQPNSPATAQRGRRTGPSRLPGAPPSIGCIAGLLARCECRSFRWSSRRRCSWRTPTPPSWRRRFPSSPVTWASTPSRSSSPSRPISSAWPIFIPVSGWVADRVGACTTFRRRARRVHGRLHRLCLIALARRVRDVARAAGCGRRHDGAGRPHDRRALGVQGRTSCARSRSSPCPR